MKTVPIDESMIQGAVSCEPSEHGLKPWRLKFSELGLHDEGLVVQASCTAGVRARVATDGEAVGLALRPYTAKCVFDLVIDGEIIATQKAAPDAKQVVFEGLPVGRKVVEIWLPSQHPTTLRGVLVPDGATVETAEDDRLRWTTYGSSITHCGDVHSPARTWPGTAARACGLNLTCMGYSGQCHMEPLMAMTIRDIPADLITLKLGINVMGGAKSLSGRTFPTSAIGLVKIIREAHPDAPIGIISPIISPPRETTPNVLDYTLQLMRKHLADVVERLKAAGDENVFYFDGLSVFGEDLAADYLPDDLHPNADGYEILGRNIVEKVLRPLLARVRRCP